MIAARLYPPVQREISRQKVWLKLGEGIEVGEVQYLGADSSRARRMVMVRQLIQDRSRATGKPLRLFQDSEIYNRYRHPCFMINLTLPAQQV